MFDPNWYNPLSHKHTYVGGFLLSDREWVEFLTPREIGISSSIPSRCPHNTKSWYTAWFVISNVWVLGYTRRLFCRCCWNFWGCRPCTPPVCTKGCDEDIDTCNECSENADCDDELGRNASHRDSQRSRHLISLRCNIAIHNGGSHRKKTMNLSISKFEMLNASQM